MHLAAKPDWSSDESSPCYADPEFDARGEPLLRLHQFTPDRVLFHYADDTRFYVDLKQAVIWATWPDSLTLEDTATYLLGPVLGYFLRRRGKVCLHASAVAVDGRCIAFAGPAGAGKSTLAAALAMKGERILAEDVSCLSQEGDAFMVQPGYPRIRLWQESGDFIGAPPEVLPLLTPTWDKRFLPLNDDTRIFHRQPERLAAVFLLAARRAMAAPAELRDLSGQEILSELVANTYGNRLLDRGQRSDEFRALGELARAVPVRALTLNADGGRLFEACVWIKRHALS